MIFLETAAEEECIIELGFRGFTFVIRLLMSAASSKESTSLFAFSRFSVISLEVSKSFSLLRSLLLSGLLIGFTVLVFKFSTFF